MSEVLGISNIVAFPLRGKGFVGPHSAMSQAADQLVALAETVLLLEAAIEGDPTLAPPLLDASRRSVVKMKDDIVRIATSLEAALARSTPTASLELRNSGQAETSRTQSAHLAPDSGALVQGERSGCSPGLSGASK